MGTERKNRFRTGDVIEADPVQERQPELIPELHRRASRWFEEQGDLVEAIFLLRAYRTTLPRFGASRPVDTGRMSCIRRVSATFKDAPGGQVLGPTFDYTHRLLDLVRRGALDPAKILTQHEPMTSVIEAYEAFDERQAGSDQPYQRRR